MSKDRKDGKYIKPVDGVHKIMPYLFNKRTESEVHIYKTLNITKLLDYLEDKNKNIEDDRKKITFFHAFLTASAKMIYNRPILNRFVQGKRYYQRNKVIFAFVAKNKFSDEAEERLIMLDVNEKNNIDDISKNILEDVQKVRDEGTNKMDKILNFVCYLPRCLLSLFVNTAKCLDFHGILPDSLTSDDIDFATVLFSNLGSIKCDAIYHHLNNYGTTSIVITIGEIKNEHYLDDKGNVKKRSTVVLGITVDERISDGFYFAKSAKILDYLFDHPELLDDEVQSKIDYEP